MTRGTEPAPGRQTLSARPPRGTEERAPGKQTLTAQLPPTTAGLAPEDDQEPAPPARVDAALARVLASHCAVETVGDAWVVHFPADVLRLLRVAGESVPMLSATLLAMTVLQATEPGTIMHVVGELIASGRVSATSNYPADLGRFRGDVVFTRFQSEVVELFREQLGTSYSGRGEKGVTEIQQARNIQDVLTRVDAAFATVAPHLDAGRLARLGITANGVRGMVHDAGGRSLLAIALLPRSTSGPIADLLAAPTIDGVAWADLLLDVLPEIIDAARKHEENETRRLAAEKHDDDMRPHRIEVKDALQFIVQNVNPGASADTGTVLGTLRAGQSIKLGERQVFLLDLRGFDAIYQDQRDGTFYRQSIRAFTQDIQASILADASSNLAGMMDAILNVGLDLISALLPPTRGAILAIRVLDMATRLHQHWPIVVLGYRLAQEGRAAIEARCPGLSDELLGAALGGVVVDWSLSPRDFVILLARCFGDSATYAITGALGKVVNALMRVVWGLRAAIDVGYDRDKARAALHQALPAPLALQLEQDPQLQALARQNLELMARGFTLIRNALDGTVR